MISVIVVDDQELLRTGLKDLAEHDGDIRVVAEAGTGRSGLSRVRELRPEVVLMDIRMPEMDGLEATRHIVADPRLTGTKVVMLTTFDEDENIIAAIRSGASGYLLKDIRAADLRAAIRTVAAGDSLLSPAVTRKVLAEIASRPERRLDTTALAGLSDREREILRHVALGLSNAEIAEALFISPATARTYVSRLLGRLDARDRSQLVIIGYETGLVEPAAEHDSSSPGW